MITISPMSGGVNHGEKQKCVLTFCPPCRTTLRDSELTLKVGGQSNLIYVVWKIPMLSGELRFGISMHMS